MILRNVFVEAEGSDQQQYDDRNSESVSSHVSGQNADLSLILPSRQTRRNAFDLWADHGS